MYHVLHVQRCQQGRVWCAALATFREPVFSPVFLRVASFDKKKHNGKVSPC